MEQNPRFRTPNDPPFSKTYPIYPGIKFQYVLGLLLCIPMFIFLIGRWGGDGSGNEDTPTPIVVSKTSQEDSIMTKTIEPTKRTTVQLTPTQNSKHNSNFVFADKIYIPASEFIMGATDLDKKIETSNINIKDETPNHTVYLDSFYIDKTEVTNAMFAVFVNETNYVTVAEKTKFAHIYSTSNENTWYTSPTANWKDPDGTGKGINGLDNYPVVQMSWEDADAFCEWRGGRLPTEAEWEKAARGIDGNIYPWGNYYDGNILNGSDITLGKDPSLNIYNDGYAFAAPVGSFPENASPYGVLDMAGNVLEWVNDYYDNEYYGKSPEKNPTGPEIGQSYILRSGSWFSGPKNNRSANRTPAENLDVASINYGFRCVYDK